MANVKKTVKKPSVKSKSKVVAGGKKTRFSKPVLVLMVLGSLLVLTAAGTFGYHKWKQNDLNAKAGRGVFINMTPWNPDNGEPTGAGNYDNAKTYMCKEVEGSRTKVRVITSAGTNRGLWTNRELTLTVYKSGSYGNPGQKYDTRQTTSWWGATEPVVAVLQAYVPASGWARVFFDPGIYPGSTNYAVATAPVNMGFVPYC